MDGRVGIPVSYQCPTEENGFVRANVVPSVPGRPPCFLQERRVSHSSAPGRLLA